LPTHLSSRSWDELVVLWQRLNGSSSAGSRHPDSALLASQLSRKTPYADRLVRAEEMTMLYGPFNQPLLRD
jgi:hypothetical protein